MDNARIFRIRYKSERDNKIPLVKMSPAAIAGYYITNYSNDPIHAIDVDLQLSVIPHITGDKARILLEVVMKGV